MFTQIVYQLRGVKELNFRKKSRFYVSIDEFYFIFCFDGVMFYINKINVDL
jgi:hypothetical protein